MDADLITKEELLDLLKDVDPKSRLRIFAHMNDHREFCVTISRLKYNTKHKNVVDLEAVEA